MAVRVFSNILKSTHRFVVDVDQIRLWRQRLARSVSFRRRFRGTERVNYDHFGAFDLASTERTRAPTFRLLKILQCLLLYITVLLHFILFYFLHSCHATLKVFVMQ